MGLLVRLPQYGSRPPQHGSQRSQNQQYSRCQQHPPFSTPGPFHRGPDLGSDLRRASIISRQALRCEGTLNGKVEIITRSHSTRPGGATIVARKTSAVRNGALDGPVEAGDRFTDEGPAGAAPGSRKTSVAKARSTEGSRVTDRFTDEGRR